MSNVGATYTGINVNVSGSGGGSSAPEYEIIYKASDTDAVSNLDPVGQMNDLSGNDNHAVQSSGALKAVYNSSDVSYNNEPSISFTLDWYRYNKVVPVNLSTGFTLWFVGSAIAGARLDLMSTPLDVSVAITFFEDFNYCRVRNTLSGASVTDQLSVPSNDFENDAVWLLAGDGANITIYKNGAVVDTQTQDVGNMLATHIGLRGTSVTTSGTLVEQRYKNAYSVSDLNTVGGALCTKYGFTWTTIV